jgi:hypothetical protein
MTKSIGVTSCAKLISFAKKYHTGGALQKRPELFTPYLAGLFTTAQEVLARGNKDELRAFRQALAAIREELPAPESSPEPASVADASDERELTDEELIAEVERAGAELAALLENPYLPESLREQIDDAVLEFLDVNTENTAASQIRGGWHEIAKRAVEQRRVENLLSRPEPVMPSESENQGARRLIELHNESINRKSLWHYVERLLYASQRCESEEGFERQMLADALALVISSPHTPVELHDDLVQRLCDISNSTKVQDPADPDNVREWFPLALRKLKQDKSE